MKEMLCFNLYYIINYYYLYYFNLIYIIYYIN